MKSLLLSFYVAKLLQQQRSMQLSLAANQDCTCSASGQAAIVITLCEQDLKCLLPYLAVS